VAWQPPPTPLPPVDVGEEASEAARRSEAAQARLGALLLLSLAHGVPLPPWLATPPVCRALLGRGSSVGFSDAAAARPQLATRFALVLASIGDETDWPDSEAPPPPPPTARLRLLREPADAVSSVGAAFSGLQLDEEATADAGAEGEAGCTPGRVYSEPVTPCDEGAAAEEGGAAGQPDRFAPSPKLRASLRALGWRLHGCRARSCAALSAGFAAAAPPALAAALLDASCEALQCVAACHAAFPAQDLEARLVFEAWPDGARTPALLLSLLRAASDAFRTRLLLLVTGRTRPPPHDAEPHHEPDEPHAPPRHASRRRSRSSAPQHAAASFGATGAPLIVRFYMAQPPTEPPPVRVLRSAGVLLLPEYPDCAVLRAALQLAIYRSPEASASDL